MSQGSFLFCFFPTSRTVRHWHSCPESCGHPIPVGTQGQAGWALSSWAGGRQPCLQHRVGTSWYLRFLPNQAILHSYSSRIGMLIHLSINNRFVVTIDSFYLHHHQVVPVIQAGEQDGHMPSPLDSVSTYSVTTPPLSGTPRDSNSFARQRHGRQTGSRPGDANQAAGPSRG